MKHTFKKFVVIALAVLMCMSSIVPAITAAETCPGDIAHTSLNCTYTVVGKTDASCEADGHVMGQCNTCGQRFVAETLEKIGHDWEIKAATCDVAGARVCKVCKKTETTGEEAGHIWGAWKANGPCKVGEKRIRTCTVCGEKEEEIMKEEHSWAVSKFVAPERCALPGYSVFKCQNEGCGEKKTQEVWLNDENGAHKWIEWDANEQANLKAATAKGESYAVKKDPNFVELTCTTRGSRTQVCKDCGLTKIVYQEHLKVWSSSDGTKVTNVAHTIDQLQFIDYIPETCENGNGTAAYWKCYDCGAQYKAIVATQGRVYAENADGKQYTKYYEYTYKKDTFGDLFYKASDLKLDNISHTWAEGAQSVTATCTTGGYTFRTCLGCGLVQNSTSEATGHLFYPDVASDKRTTVLNTLFKNTNVDKANWTVIGRVNERILVDVVEATCTTDGYHLYRCLNVDTNRAGTSDVDVDDKYQCNETKKVTLESDKAKGHTYSTTPDATHPVAVPATCETAGVEVYKCKDCDAYTTKQVAALGHIMEKNEAKSSDPTCEDDGILYTECARCDYFEEVEVEATANDHVWNTDVPTLAPTCDKAGKIVRYCMNSKCTAEARSPKEYELPALGHKYVDVKDYETQLETLAVGGKIKDDDGNDLIEYVRAGDCEKTAVYKLFCQNEGCAMFTNYEIKEGFAVEGGHKIVLVYNNKAVATAGTNAVSGIEANVHFLPANYNKYGEEANGTTSMHNGGAGFGVTNLKAPTHTAAGYSYYWYCENDNCTYSRDCLEAAYEKSIDLAHPDSTDYNKFKIAPTAAHHEIVKENGSTKAVTYLDVPDERVSKAISAAKAQKVPAPVDENGNITAIAIDIPGTSLVWRYYIEEGSCEYDQVTLGGFWCVDCGKGISSTNSLAPDAVLGVNKKETYHNAKNFVTTVSQPDCQNYGYTRTACPNCDYEVLTNYVEPTEHVFKKITEVPVYCERDGYILNQCEICEIYETVVPDALVAPGHKNISGQALRVSCLDITTVTDRKCANCGDIIIADHKYVDGKCRDCGIAKAN